MNSTRLLLTFSIDNSSTLNSLEAVLAIARRGGLRLAGLTLSPAACHDRVLLHVLADEAGLLDLFQARLSNLIGVYDIHACREILHS